MRILQLDFYGDHNIGLFGHAAEKLCILGRSVSDKDCADIEKVLGVKVVKTTVANTDLAGLMCCMNSNGVVLPSIAKDEETARLESLGMNVLALETKFTAIGNLVLCNDKGAVVGKPLARCREKMSRCLGVDVRTATIAGMNTVGSCGIATNSGCLLHRDAMDKEIRIVEKTLGVEVGIGTANFGSPFVGSCAIANSSAVAVGGSTTGPEMNRFIETLLRN